MNEERFWSLCNKQPSGCWEWQGTIGTGGYGKFNRGRGLSASAHRIAFELVHGAPAKQHVLHHCDNRRCINPEHLFEGSPADNQLDKVRKGRQLKGQTHPMARLTGDQALAIINDPRKTIEIANEYGINRNQVNRIKSGKRWKTLERK